MSVIKFFGIPWGFEEDLGPYDITGWFSPKTDDVITIYVTYDKVSYINQVRFRNTGRGACLK